MFFISEKLSPWSEEWVEAAGRRQSRLKQQRTLASTTPFLKFFRDNSKTGGSKTQVKVRLPRSSCSTWEQLSQKFGRRQNAEPYSMEYPMDYPNGVP